VQSDVQERGVAQYNENTAVSSQRREISADADEGDPDEMANEYLDAYATNRIMLGDPGSDKHKKNKKQQNRRCSTLLILTHTFLTLTFT
jgi:hypothetical protein